MDSTTPPDTTAHLTTEFNLAVKRAMETTPLNTLSNAVGTVIRADHDLEMGSNHTQGNPLDDISHNNNMTSLSQPEATRPLLSQDVSSILRITKQHSLAASAQANCTPASSHCTSDNELLKSGMLSTRDLRTTNDLQSGDNARNICTCTRKIWNRIWTSKSASTYGPA